MRLRTGVHTASASADEALHKRCSSGDETERQQGEYVKEAVETYEEPEGHASFQREWNLPKFADEQGGVDGGGGGGGGGIASGYLAAEVFEERAGERWRR